MKISVLIVFSLLTINAASSQSLGCVDCRWIFDLPNRGITEMNFEKDTIIDDASFDKYSVQISRIHSNGIDTIRGNSDPIYLSNQDGLVLYRWTREMTDTIVDFNAKIGDSWTVIDRIRDDKYYEYIVLDTFRTLINGNNLFSISYDSRPVGTTFSFVDTLYETIGSKYSFIIPHEGYEIYPDGGTLRCFTNDNLGFVQLDNAELYGSSLYSDFEFDCDRLTSTNNIEEKPQGRLRLYPNPVHDVLYIESDSQEEGRLYNQQGQQVRVYKKTGTLDMNTLESGIYFLKVGEQVRKVVKM